MNIRLPKDYYAAFQALPPEQRTFAGLAKIDDEDDEVRHRLVELVRFGLQLFRIPEQYAGRLSSFSLPMTCASARFTAQLTEQTLRRPGSRIRSVRCRSASSCSATQRPSLCVPRSEVALTVQHFWPGRGANSGLTMAVQLGGVLDDVYRAPGWNRTEAHQRIELLTRHLCKCASLALRPGLTCQTI